MKFNKQDKILTSNKAYDNFEFIHSSDGRIMRIMAEYIYPEQYLKRRNVKGAIVFYGSARTLSRDHYDAKMKLLQTELKQQSLYQSKQEIKNKILALEKIEDITNYYEEAVELSKMLAEWLAKNPSTKNYFITSGGGPGMMEAANLGSYLAQRDNIGFNISLPFEQKPNKFITPELNFEFHYFFMRKFWFVYLAKAIVTLPGGFGTLDELMEILTLRQTAKVTKPLPIVLYGESFWKKLIDIDLLVEKGMIEEKDLKLFKYCNTPQEAFDYITTELEKTFTRKDTHLSLK